MLGDKFQKEFTSKEHREKMEKQRAKYDEVMTEEEINKLKSLPILEAIEFLGEIEKKYNMKF